MSSKYKVGTIVQDTFHPMDDFRPKYELLENGKWNRINENWIHYTIDDKSIGEGKRFSVVPLQPTANETEDKSIEQMAEARLNHFAHDLKKNPNYIIENPQRVRDFDKGFAANTVNKDLLGQAIKKLSTITNWDSFSDHPIGKAGKEVMDILQKAEEQLNKS